jgi:hypothetical protein
MKTLAEKTRIIACRCVHSYQDQKYGAGLRVHNRAKETGKGATSNVIEWRCTVCSSVK